MKVEVRTEQAAIGNSIAAQAQWEARRAVVIHGVTWQLGHGENLQEVGRREIAQAPRAESRAYLPKVAQRKVAKLHLVTPVATVSVDNTFPSHTGQVLDAGEFKGTVSLWAGSGDDEREQLAVSDAVSFNTIQVEPTEFSLRKDSFHTSQFTTLAALYSHRKGVKNAFRKWCAYERRIEAATARLSKLSVYDFERSIVSDYKRLDAKFAAVFAAHNDTLRGVTIAHIKTLKVQRNTACANFFKSVDAVQTANAKRRAKDSAKRLEAQEHLARLAAKVAEMDEAKIAKVLAKAEANAAKPQAGINFQQVAFIE